ncbi:MAG: hypothetical protein RIM23_03800 [Coleofasciculus sp. G3-WIS-01]|uniref:hypothetical protein n=1 Tax=Coleofasciculus sp. G3-WIS-01 TaxID=3069528 RepID=UPI0032F9A86B
MARLYNGDYISKRRLKSLLHLPFVRLRGLDYKGVANPVLVSFGRDAPWRVSTTWLY